MATENEIKATDALVVQMNTAQQIQNMVLNNAVQTIRQLEQKVLLLTDSVAEFEDIVKEQLDVIAALESELELCE